MSFQARRHVEGGLRLSVSRLVGFVGALILLLALSACDNGGGGGGGPGPAPTLAITSQPSDLAVTAGTPASFHVSANMSATYQWQRQQGSAWVAIAGATDNTYSIATPLVADDGARLRVVVTAMGNTASTVTSSAVTLSVAAAPQAPVIVVVPADVSLVEGTDGALSVTASGTSPTYRWQRSADGTTFADVAGGDAATLALTHVALADDGSSYRVIIANAVGSTTSAVVHLHVSAAPVAPVFTTMPTDVTVVATQTATFTAAVTGTPVPTLSWQVSTDGTSWSTLAGETGSSLVLVSVVTADSGKHYRAVANNASGQVESVGATLTVTPQPVAAFITASPSDTSVGIGGVPVFHALAGGTPAPGYQWQLSTDAGTTYANVNGATSADLTLPAAVPGDDGKRVRVVATNASGSATSASALLAVRPAPHITLQPEAQAWRTGLPTPIFQVAGAGTGLTYRWQMRIGSGAFGDIAGATSASVTVTPPASDAAVRAIVTNAAGDSATSDVAALTHLHWAFISPMPTGEEMRAVRWLDATTILAVGTNGSAIRSTDAGATWSVVEETDAAHATTLMGLAASPSGSTVVAVGLRGVIRRSTDGGLHWLTVNAATSTGPTLVAASFADATTVVAVGSGGAMLRSADAGLTWTPVNTGVTRDFQALEFRAGVGIAVTTDGTIIRSINGGMQWTTVFSNITSSVYRIAFASNSVVIVGVQQYSLRSTDAGQTWTGVATDANFEPGDVAFGDALHGFELPGSDGTSAFATADGGLTWNAVAGWPVTSGVASITWPSVRFGPNGVGMVVGSLGTLRRTTDYGQTWTEVSVNRIPNGDSILNAAFVSSTTGAAVSATQLYRTSDGGLHWSVVSNGDHSVGSNTWSFVRALDATRLLAVDLAGNVLGSSDAGATWTARAATAPIRYNGGMAFADASFGFVVTGDGVVQRTTDGGASWTTVYTSPGHDCANDVAVASHSVAVVSGCSGTLLRTADGGATWTQVRNVLGTPAWVVFSDANNGISTGLKYFSGTSVGMFQRTRDGGATWQDVSIASTTFNFGKPWFASAMEGFVAADQEYWHTIDGGATWTLEGVEDSASAGVALDTRTSLVFGPRGNVVRRTN